MKQNYIHGIPFIIIYTSFSFLAQGDMQPICINGLFDDWAGVKDVVQDKIGDSTGTIDFTLLSIADDEINLFIRLSAVDEFDASDDNNISIYLDTDMNAKTGIQIGGIGAELRWELGNKTGTYVNGSDSIEVPHRDIKFRGAPTVTSTQFEFAISLSSTPMGDIPLFPEDEVRIIVVDHDSNEMIPNENSALTYTLGQGSVPPVDVLSFAKQHRSHIRMMTHNVLNDNLFDSDKKPSFIRMYLAVSPDIIHFQEINTHTVEETEALIETELGGEWFGEYRKDCKTISRFPILDKWDIGNNLATLIDTTSAIGTTMLCINAHPPCCGNDSARQNEMDAIAAFIRDAYLPGGQLTLDPSIPVTISGDLNLVGTSQNLRTLLTGDIQDEDIYGPDGSPDPDGSDLANVESRLTERRMGYTWRNDTSSYWPGHLDYHIYSDSNLVQTHTFIVNTTEMSEETLLQYGLEDYDSTYSDHLVFCVDFKEPCLADTNADGVVDITDLLSMISQWGDCDNCAGDVNDDGTVDINDLLIVISNWGSCEQ